jgi:hypothetical protein
VLSERKSVQSHHIGQTNPKLAKTYNFFQQLSQTINKWKVSFLAGVGLHKKYLL